MTWSSRAIGVALGLAAVVSTAPGQALHDAFTPVLIRPVAPNVAPVQGDDDRYHIVYELWLTNAKAVPATIERIEVLDAGDHSRVLKHILDWPKGR